jgi:hypothetical protein
MVQSFLAENISFSVWKAFFEYLRPLQTLDQVLYEGWIGSELDEAMQGLEVLIEAEVFNIEVLFGITSGDCFYLGSWTFE